MGGKSIWHVAEKKLFEMALDDVLKNPERRRNDGYSDLVDAIEKVMKDGWEKKTYDGLRKALSSEGKWTRYFDRLLREGNTEYIKGLLLSLGFEGGFTGFRKTRQMAEELGVSIPWIILFDPTTSCNLHCKGCWASEYEHTLNMSEEEMDDLICQANELGIYEFLMTGGEPLCRKNSIVDLALRHTDCGFMIFTNGTLIDQKFCDDLLRCKNIMLILSIEGDEEATDARRGTGVFKRVTEAMKLLKENGIVYGTSICYTKDNIEAVTSDEFYDFLIDMGVVFSWYFHYMPVGNDASPKLIPTAMQREYMYRRIREIRGFEGGKPIFLIDFQNDAEFVGGCVAGGKYYCHINSNGDVEPCVFIHYSGANIHDMPLRECLRQPLFAAYQKRQPFNSNMLRPCPMLENPKILREMVNSTGAQSTDMLSRESCDHLCMKCDTYAEKWEPIADRLWEKNRGKTAQGGAS